MRDVKVFASEDLASLGKLDEKISFPTPNDVAKLAPSRWHGDHFTAS
jgi:hypothetical protein